jgi:hypothetical protein
VATTSDVKLERNRKYREANRDKILAQKREHYQANRGRYREWNRQWAAANPERAAEQNRAKAGAYYARLRAKVLDRYGTACACCGGTDRLGIDHIDGNGGEHRKELFGSQRAGIHMYLWLQRNGFPDGYQTLCYWCNRSKGKGGHCQLAHQEVA